MQDTPILYKLVVQNHIITKMTKGAQVSNPHAQLHIRKDNLISRYFLSAHITNSICNKSGKSPCIENNILCEGANKGT